MKKIAVVGKLALGEIVYFLYVGLKVSLASVAIYMLAFSGIAGVYGHNSTPMKILNEHYVYMVYLCLIGFLIWCFLKALHKILHIADNQYFWAEIDYTYCRAFKPMEDK
ncbi:hypothetical protein ACFL5C_00180 [Candidatus Omnitrophota bacterium]